MLYKLVSSKGINKINKIAQRAERLVTNMSRVSIKEVERIQRIIETLGIQSLEDAKRIIEAEDFVEEQTSLEEMYNEWFGNAA